MTQIHKEYEKYFWLEPTKLSRIIDKIHERLADHQHTTTRDDFTVFLKGSRREDLTNVEDVLALDNSQKHKIQRLLIVCSASTAGAVRAEHEVKVDFPSLTSPTSTAQAPGGTATPKAAVAISVRSDTRGWASRTLSEVEEQVERTWQPYAQPVLVLVGIALGCLLVLLFLLPPSAPPERRDDSRRMWLKDSDLEFVDALVRQPRSISDQDLREVVTRQLRNVVETERPQRSTIRHSNRQLLFIGIPLAIVVACALLLAFTCYPRAVFLWGDEVDRYAGMLQRRRILWGAIGTILFAGLLSKFLYEGIVPWLLRQ